MSARQHESSAYGSLRLFPDREIAKSDDFARREFAHLPAKMMYPKGPLNYLVPTPFLADRLGRQYSTLRIDRRFSTSLPRNREEELADAIKSFAPSSPSASDSELIGSTNPSRQSTRFSSSPPPDVERPFERCEDKKSGYQFLKEMIGEGNGSWWDIEENLRKMVEAEPIAVLDFFDLRSSALSKEMAKRPINGKTFTKEQIKWIQYEALDMLQDSCGKSRSFHKRRQYAQFLKELVYPGDPLDKVKPAPADIVGWQRYFSPRTDRREKPASGRSSSTRSSDPPARKDPRRLRPWEKIDDEDFGYEFLKEVIGDGDGSLEDIDKNLAIMSKRNPSAVLEFCAGINPFKLAKQVANRPINGRCFSAEDIIEIQHEAVNYEDVRFM